MQLRTTNKIPLLSTNCSEQSIESWFVDGLSNFEGLFSGLEESSLSYIAKTNYV